MIMRSLGQRDMEGVVHDLIIVAITPAGIWLAGLVLLFQDPSLIVCHPAGGEAPCNPFEFIHHLEKPDHFLDGDACHHGAFPTPPLPQPTSRPHPPPLPDTPSANT